MRVRRGSIFGSLAWALLGVILSSAAMVSADEDLEADILPYDRIYLTGNSAVVEGTIIEEDQRRLRVRKPNGVIFEILRAEVREIERRRTPSDVYKRHAATLPSEAVEERLRLARWCLGHELSQEAEAEARHVLELDAKLLAAYHVLVDVYALRMATVAEAFHETLTDEELSVFYAADANGVESPKLLIAGGQGLLRSQLSELAVALLRRAADMLAGLVAAGTDDAWLSRHLIADWDQAATLLRTARLSLCEALLKAERPADAAASVEAMLAVPGEEDVSALYARGRARCAIGDVVGAVSDLNLAASLDAESGPIRLAQGVALYLRGDLPLAVAALEGALGLGLEDERQARWHLGLTYLRMGRYRSAKVEFVQVLTLDPNDSLGLVGIALVQAGRGEHDDALATLDRAVARSPLDSYPIYLRGVVQLTAKRVDQGRADMLDALRLGYDFDAVCRGLALAYELAGESRAAARCYAYLTAAERPDADDWYGLGRSLLMLERLSDARFALGRALEVDPDHADALSARGYAHYVEGDRTAAGSDFTAAVQRDPESAYARRGLDYLENARTRRVWSDTFERSDGADVRNRWSEDERFGVHVRLESGRVVMGGRQANQANGTTRLVRRVVGAPVAEFTAMLNTSRAGEARVGMRLEAGRDGDVVVFREGDGRLLLAWRVGTAWSKEPVDCGQWPSDGGSHRLAIEVVDLAAGRVAVLVDDERRGECEVPSLGRARQMDLVVYGRAEVGVAWTLVLDEVSVFVARQSAGGQAPTPGLPPPGGGQGGGPPGGGTTGEGY